MTTLRCLHCGAETSNGLALCETCQYGASMWLQYLPIYFRNLARQQRPGRPNGSMTTSGQWLIRRGETDTSLIPKALDRAANDLTTWARALADDRGLEVPVADSEAEVVTLVCAFLADHLTSIATLEWAGQCVRDLGKHEKALRELTEAVVPGWYAGACRQVTGRTMEGDEYRCGTTLYVVPGLTWVTCSGCGAATAARDHLETILDEARGWVARPKVLAGTLVALIDTELSVPRLYDRIRQWAHRGDVQPIRRTARDYGYDVMLDRIVLVDEEVGPARYRLGEVLDVLMREGATRLHGPRSKAG